MGLPRRNAKIGHFSEWRGIRPKLSPERDPRPTPKHLDNYAFQQQSEPTGEPTLTDTSLPIKCLPLNDAG